MGFYADQELKKVAVSGGAPVAITEIDRWARSGSFSPDGVVVLSRYGGEGLLSVKADGGVLETLTIPNRDRREKTHRYAEVLPGGEHVLFTLGTGDIESYGDASIAVLSRRTGDYRVVHAGGTSGRYSSSGHLVYARSGNLLAVPFDLSALRVTGPPVRVVEGVSMSPSMGKVDFSLSQEGSLLYARGGVWGMDRRVVWVDREGRSEPLLETGRAYATSRLSPDGRFLALDIDAANANIWLYDFIRRSMSRLTFGHGFDSMTPIWTPDGDRVVARHLPSDNLFWQVVDGSGSLERLLTSEYPQTPGSFSPDGKTFIFHESLPETGDDIWMLPLHESGSPRPLLHTSFNEIQPEVSPDGRWLAYRSDESGRNEIYLRSFPASGPKRQVSTSGGTDPAWNPNGRELFYRNGDKMMAVDIETDGEGTLGESRRLFQRRFAIGRLAFRNWDVSRDGERFVMIDDNQAKRPPTELVLVQNFARELTASFQPTRQAERVACRYPAWVETIGKCYQFLQSVKDQCTYMSEALSTRSRISSSRVGKASRKGVTSRSTCRSSPIKGRHDVAT